MTVEELIVELLDIDPKMEVEFSNQDWPLSGESVEAVYIEGGKVKLGN